MKIFSFKDNRDSLVLVLNDVVLRFDLYQKNIDLLYTGRFAHRRVIKAQPLIRVLPCDIEVLLQRSHQLLREFTLDPHEIQKVFRHDRNDRFVLLECIRGRRLELDKDLNGVKDRSLHQAGNMYKRKPDNYYRDTIVREYLRINHDQKRIFSACLRAIRHLNQEGI